MKKIILNVINSKLTLPEKIVFYLFKNYTYKVYKTGFQEAYFKEKNVSNLFPTRRF